VCVYIYVELNTVDLKRKVEEGGSGTKFNRCLRR
jgi:hypothetical protein